MTTSYKNQGAGYSIGSEIDQGAWQESNITIGGAATISANGALTLIGWSSEQTGSVGISGNGSLTCFGTSVSHSGVVSISGNGSIVNIGSSGRLGDVDVTGNGSLIFPERAWGSVGITANGTLTIIGSNDHHGSVAINANGAISGVFWINQPVEKVWLDSKLVQGVVGTSILKRVSVHGC